MTVSKSYNFNLDKEDKILTCIHWGPSISVTIMTGGTDENNLYLNIPLELLRKLYKQLWEDLDTIDKKFIDAEDERRRAHAE